MFFASQQQRAAERQQQLRARSSQLRDRLATDAEVLRRPLALADQVRHGWQWLQGHPEWLAGGVLALAVLRPRRVWRLAGRAWAGWQLWRRLQGWHGAWLAARAPARPPGRAPARARPPP